MATLHILNKAPDHPRFQACLSAVTDGDTLLLTENAVLAAAMKRSLPARVLVLRDDLEARGLSSDNIPEHIGSIDFAAFVDLTETTTRIISW
jgi:tRNA 2-thiouridine synthesizing protein B